MSDWTLYHGDCLSVLRTLPDESVDSLVLDCFAGSGSTLVAALKENMRVIGIEREAEYVEIIRGRVQHAERKQVQAEFEGVA